MTLIMKLIALTNHTIQQVRRQKSDLEFVARAQEYISW